MNELAVGIICTLVGAILAAGGTFTAMARSQVTKADVVTLIAQYATPREAADQLCQVHCPYLRDEKVIAEKLDRIEAKVDALQGDWRKVVPALEDFQRWRRGDT